MRKIITYIFFLIIGFLSGFCILSFDTGIISKKPFLKKAIVVMKKCKEENKKDLKLQENYPNSKMIKLEMELNNCYEAIIHKIHKKYYPKRYNKINYHLEKSYKETIILYNEIYQKDQCYPNCGTLVPLFVYNKMSVFLEKYLTSLIKELNIN